MTRKRSFAAILTLSLILSTSLTALAQDAQPSPESAKIQKLLSQGSYAQAETEARALVAALQRGVKKGQEPKPVALALQDLAYALAGQGKVDEALQQLEASVAIQARLNPDDPDLAQTLNDQGVILTQLARYAEAEELHSRALAIREKVLAADNPNIAQSLNNLALAKKRQGKDKEVEPLLSRAALIQEKALGPEDPQLGDTLADLADILQAQGRADEAEPLAARALVITEKALGPNDGEVARRLIKLGNVQEAQGRFKESEGSFRRALGIREALFGADSRQAAGVLSNLADTVLADKRPAEAEPLLRRAVELQTKVRGATHPATGQSISRLANALRDQGKLDEAKPLYDQALTIREGAFGPDHPEVAETLQDAAELAFKQGRFEDAFKLYQRAAGIYAKRASLDDPITNENTIFPRKEGEVFRRFAEAGFELAERDESRRSELATATFQSAQFAARSRTGIALEQLAERLALADPKLADLMRKRQDLAKQWKDAETAFIEQLGQGSAGGKGGQGNGGGGAGNGGGNGGGKGQGGGNGVVRLAQNGQDQTRGIVDAGEAGGFAAKMADLEKQIAAIDAQLKTLSPQYAALLDPEPLNMGRVQKALGPDDALITYLVNQNNTLVWAVTRERVVWANADIGEEGIEALTARLRAGVDKQGAKFDFEAATTLYEALLGPDRLAGEISAKKHLVIVPSGPLTGLPFHVLVTKQPDAGLAEPEVYRKADWVLRTHAVSVLPSVSSLETLTKLGPSKALLPFLGVGNPVFKSPGGGGDARGLPATVDKLYTGRAPDLEKMSRSLPPLPETAAELRFIAQIMGAAPDSVILGDKASETSVKKLDRNGTLQSYKVVHFATHGLVAGEVEKLVSFRAEPALALTLPASASEDDDGLLTASEAAALKLDADWVVLSACNTAAGDKPGAEALSGLARAFFYAGARTLLVSHWAVNSEAAVKLTTSVFTRLAADRNLTRADALRRSMLEILDGTSADEANPNYWAPFAVVGYGGL